ncbi:phage upper tail fiber protein [Bacteroides clarus]|jgi:hypothetical protein|uniref:phage upper tail fiber protein n=1 Tax=Bacteroides clarus TaxID=626929 RepID=UPI0018AC5B34|nr:hypothetical protein [Bacteroides clarus]
MPLRKKKISELPLADSLKGLYTIGYKIIDGIKTSVKVSLEDIQTAYQDVVNAIKKSEEAAKNANNAATTANEKAVLADTAAANANDTAEHPTYIGQDHYVYKWNKTAQAYDKTDIYTKGDAFSIKKVYASVANMEADKSNPDITEGDFVLVNTGDVEDPDNAKLYVKADGDFEFLVDMSGAIGFTGKTPQFSMGTVTTLEAGASATATVSSDGTDEGGNPKYKLNFAIPRGNPGAPFRVAGEYTTLEALKSAVPDGSAVDGFMAVGTEAPYDYYAWVNGDWANQGKIAGGGSGNVVVIPAAAMSLSDQATSDEIFNAFGGKDAFMDICQSIVNKDTVCVVANIPEESGMKLVYIPVMAMATYTDANNANFMMAIITETTFQLVVTVTDGIATQSSQVLNHIYEAPSDGNVYGRKNKDWVKVPENSNVIILPKEILDLTGSSSSEEILAAFGGIDKYKDLLEKLSTNNCLVQIGEPSLGSLRHIYTLVEYAVNFASNKQSGALSLNIYNEEQQLRRLHFYSENNGTTARCGEASTFQLVRDTDVLTKTNTSSFTPTQPYHPATKKYVDDSIKESLYYVNNDKFLSYFITPAYRIDSDAEDSIIMCFNTIDNFKAFVDKAIDAGVTLVFINNNLNEKIYIRDYHVYRSNNNNRELSFIFNYSNNGESFQFITTRVFISYNASYGYKFVVKNLISSDNLTTITKKTAAEYEAIGSKDANTAYCVTD